MTKQTRRRLFYLFAFIFFATIPLLVFYTQGYRIDLKEFKPVKTGGIDLDISNPGTKIYLNGKLEKETVFIFNRAVFRNIPQGTYDIGIEKDGYINWGKDIEVEASRVSKYINIRLFPEEMRKTVLADELTSAFPSPNKRVAIIQTPSSVTSGTTTEKTTQISLVEMDRPAIRSIITLDPSDELRGVKWSSNSEIFNLIVDGDLGTTLYSGSVGGSQEVTSWNPFLQRSFPMAYEDENIIVPTNSTESIFVLEEEAKTDPEKPRTYSLSRVELDPAIIRPDILRGIAAFSIVDDDIFYIDSKGVLYQSNISSPDPVQMSETGVAKPGAIEDITVHGSKDMVLIRGNVGLYLWQKDFPLEKIAGHVNGAEFSPIKEALSFWDDENVSVYWTEEVFGPPSRERGDIELIGPIKGIKNVIWATDGAGHVGIQTESEIIFAELDSRNRRNSVRYDIPTSDTFFLKIPGKLELYTILPENAELTGFNYE